jgi:anti-sigma factor RsiW
MVISCHEIWQRISDYIDDELSPEMRQHIEEHLEGCRHCSALLDSTRNIIVLIADEKTFDIPVDFSQRLHAKLALEMSRES